MSTTWIVSANASRARFFSQARPSDSFEEISDMANTAARLRTSDTETDRLGPTAATKSIHNVGGATPNKTYQPAQSPAQHEMELFARDVAAFLLRGHQEGRYKQLALFSSPEFLGVLRKQLDPEVKSAVNHEINKDYTQFTAAQLQAQLASLKT